MIAAVAKLREPDETERSFDALAIPQPRLAARFVPIIELLLAAALIVTPALGAGAALATLAFFTTLLIGRIRSGFTAPCRCFGSVSDQPLSWRDVGRNLVFCGLAITGLLVT